MGGAKFNILPMTLYVICKCKNVMIFRDCDGAYLLWLL